MGVGVLGVLGVGVGAKRILPLRISAAAIQDQRPTSEQQFHSMPLVRTAVSFEGGGSARQRLAREAHRRRPVLEVVQE